MGNLYKLVTIENADLIYDEFEKEELIECILELRNTYFRLKKVNEQLQQELEQRPYYKFYRYENNPYGSDYCFCQRPCDSNMSLKCFLENGEILGFMSESLAYKYPEIKEVDLNEFAHDFVKPLIKEKQQLKDVIVKVKKLIEEYKEQWYEFDEVTSDINHLLQILDKVGD